MASKAALLNHKIVFDNTDSTQLVEEDLLDMMTALVTLFHKWKEIGTALGLRHYILEIIEAKCRTNVRLALQEVMVEFVRKNYNCDRFGEPSWQSLAKAVAHPVGAADVPVALEIANAHPATGEQKSPIKPVRKQDSDPIYSFGCPVHLLKYDWYHGELSLEDAAKILITKGGSCFLVREDKDNSGTIVLSVKGEGGMVHLTVNRGPGWYAVEGATKQFETVAELVTYYETNSLDDNSNLLLGSPCLKTQDSSSGTTNNGSESVYQVGAPSELMKHSWYAGKLSQEAARKKLSAAEDSRFLVWVDDSSELFLSLKRPNEISHVKIECGPDWYTVDSTFQLFPSVPDLVHYYNLDLFPAAPDTATYYNLNGNIQSGAVRAQHIYEYIDVKTTKLHEYDYIRFGEHSKLEYDYIRVGENAKHVYDVVQSEGSGPLYEYVSPQTIQEDIKKSKSGTSSNEPDHWFHGEITREQAALLVSTGPNGRKEGFFLVRDSLKSPGSYVLTFWSQNQVRHLQIVNHNEGWYSLDNGPIFQGVDEVINHYLAKADGLLSKLQDFAIGGPLPHAARKRVDTDYHRAARIGDVVLLKRLLSQLSSVNCLNSRSPDGSTPVHEAAKRGYMEVLLLLLEHKPDLNETYDLKGAAAIHLAASNGHAETIRLLVEKGGADVQERNGFTGWVALHEAAFRGHADCVKVLLQLNAPLRPRTPEEDTPMELAAKYKQNEVVDVLKWAYENPQKPRTRKHEWLHRNLSRLEAVQLLMRKGKGNGSFLIRPHSRRPGYYALTMLYNSLPYHWEVVCQDDQWYFIDDGPLFTSLPEVVDHYMRFQDGLATRLQHPVPSPHADTEVSAEPNRPAVYKTEIRRMPRPRPRDALPRPLNIMTKSEVASSTPDLPPKPLVASSSPNSSIATTSQAASSRPSILPKTQATSSRPKPPTKPKPTSRSEHSVQISAVRPTLYKRPSN